MDLEKAEFVRERYEEAYAAVQRLAEGEKTLLLEEKHLHRRLEVLFAVPGMFLAMFEVC